MNCLELHVRRGGLDERRQRRLLVVQESFEVSHAFSDGLRWRRNEAGVPGSGTSDPVLRNSELARLFVTPPSAGKEYGMNLAYQPVRNGECVVRGSSSCR